MEEIYIKEIKIKNVRNIKNFPIFLSENKKLNLIITGKNGSGKTSFLNELKAFLNNVTNRAIEFYEGQLRTLQSYESQKSTLLEKTTRNENQLQQIENDINNIEQWLKGFGGTEIVFNKPLAISSKFEKGDYIIAFFGAKRNTSLKSPKGVNKINIKNFYGINEIAGVEFIQYIVNLKADRSFAKDDGDLKTVENIDIWFNDFEKNLFELFETQNIKLVFDRKSYNFNIIEDSKEPYNLNQLSDGYSAILNIVTELIMRMEEHKSKNYDVEGLVLIDEIETHLHIELQKKVLPFLTAFFPKIQFIVTTHSPFVISSIENAVICDLEKKIVTSDLTGYSYDTLIESYFDSDKYSTELKRKIEEYEKYSAKPYLSNDEKVRFTNLKTYLTEIPKFISDELAVKIQQIKLKDLKRKD